MYYWQEKDIKINENSKLIIGIGDSFVQGQGCCSQDIWEKYNWNVDEMNKDENIDVWKSCYENSFINVLCKNYFKDYISVNLGMLGRGNRAAVKELYLHPELNIQSAKEKIVIYVITGKERFDFIHKNFAEHHHFKTIWPSVRDENDPEKPIWGAYWEQIYNEKFSCIELILNILEAQTWCEANNANLILVSGFSEDLKKEVLYKKIRGKNYDNNTLHREPHRVEALVNSINWDLFFHPDGLSCLTEYMLKLENRSDLIGLNQVSNFYDIAQKSDKFSPNGYITKCGHPTQKGQLEIAKLISEYITNKNYIK